VLIGEGSNIQDNCVIHSDLGAPVVIGKRVTVGHGSVLRACRIGDRSMIGMNSTVMSGVAIGERCVVGAHSLITYNQRFDHDSLIMGVPAKRIRGATEEEKQYSGIACDVYSKLVVEYRDGKFRSHNRED
jgi:carbonic anhydrase/acetyltransferase-like protein (isoleucine patch superfamily)